MPLGTEVGLGPGDIVLDGDPASPQKRAQQPLPNFWFMSIVDKRSPIPAGILLILSSAGQCYLCKWTLCERHELNWHRELQSNTRKEGRLAVCTVPYSEFVYAVWTVISSCVWKFSRPLTRAPAER